MFRLCVFLGSLLLAAVSISTAGFAADLGELRFTLESRGGGNAQVGFDLQENDGQRHDRWNTNSTMPVRDLNGLAPGDLIGGGSRPLRLALVREAGRLDCAGSGGNGRGSGRCRFTADPAFLALLAQAGIRAPDQRDAFGMVILDVRRDLVAAVRDAHYRNATPGDLTALAALGVTPAYIRELDRRGYRPDSLNDLTAFKALGVTPAYVDGLSRAGFGRVAPDAIVQMKALGITAADYARFRRRFGRVDVDRLVQAKALGVVHMPSAPNWRR